MTETIPWHTDKDLAEHDAAHAQREYDEQLDMDVAREVRRLRIQHTGRSKFAAELAAAIALPPFDAGTLREVLARPQPPKARVEDLIPYAGGTLVVAQRKTGKTTLELNLARSLINGSDFLGRFPVRAISGSVGFLNYEVSAAQLAHWAAEHGIPEDRLFLANLRGRRNPLSNDADRALLIAELRSHEVESLIVDPFGRAFTGKSQNDPGDVGAWLSNLDQFARGDGVGALDVILSAHAGWDGERTRGSTALEDWADSVITLVRDRDDDRRRFMRAEGRDVLVDEDQLLYDTDSRTLTLAGSGSRKTTSKVRQLEAQKPVVVELLAETPAMSGNQLDEALRKTDLPHSKGDGTRSAQLLERDGLVTSKDGPRRARLFSLTTSPTSPNSPQGNSNDFPHLPYRGEVVGGVKEVTSPAGEVPPSTSGGPA